MTRYTGDGREVATTAAEAAAFDAAPLLVLSALRGFLALHGLGDAPLGWERIGEGQSNITFAIECGTRRFVLRRGPRPPHPPSTHDMVREARILRVLAREGMPVPEVVAVCEDTAVLGVPFYLMEFIDGEVITGSVPPTYSMADRTAVSETTVDTLVNLHGLDVTQGELASIGRPAGYLARQVERFGSLWGVNSRRVIPAVDALAEWLRDNLPATQRHSVVHGDYRIGNLMFAPSPPVRVEAILDWEMATLGDPLADLGYLTATYAEQSTRWTPMELTSVTRNPGFLSRDELISRYHEQMPLDLSSLPWYQTFALWSLEHGIPRLLEEAAAFARIDVRTDVVDIRSI
jgi:aminoglycoside phosphotransferase (APT) family kinase protein